MNILHLSSEKTWRGGEQQIAYLIEELIKLGVTNYVAARKGSAFEAYCIHKNIVVFPLPFKNSIDLATAWSLKSICRNKHIDIIHLHSAKSQGIGVLSVVLGNHLPMVLSRRVVFSPKQTWFTKWKYNHPSIKKIICVSNKVSNIIQSYIKLPEKCITVYDGIDLTKMNTIVKSNALRNEFNIPPEVQLIGNTSALESEKDYFTFIRTVEILIQKKIPVQAVIIGKGSMEAELKNYCKQHGIENLIHFTGFRNDVLNILSELNIFLMPSREEGLGTSILDAFLVEVPVVATIAGGIPEIVIHEQTGMLAPVGGAEELARHIERIISDQHLRKTVVDGALKKVKEFSKEATAVKTLGVYTQILTQV